MVQITLFMLLFLCKIRYSTDLLLRTVMPAKILEMVMIAVKEGGCMQTAPVFPWQTALFLITMQSKEVQVFSSKTLMRLFLPVHLLVILQTVWAVGGLY